LESWKVGHVLQEGQKDLPSALADDEYPVLLRGLDPLDPFVTEFEEQITLFRDLVLNSKDVQLSRYSGDLEGELGLKTRRACSYSHIRAAIPGFVTEILDEGVWRRLTASGYSSLLADGRRHFILFGPLALVMDGKDDLWFGPVQGWMRWSSYDPFARVFRRGSEDDDVKLILLGGIPKKGEVRKRPRSAFAANDEIVVPYSGMRSVSHFSTAAAAEVGGERVTALSVELDRGSVEMSVAGVLGRLGQRGSDEVGRGGAGPGKEAERGKARSKTPLSDAMVTMAATKRTSSTVSRPSRTSQAEEEKEGDGGEPSAAELAAMRRLRQSYRRSSEESVTASRRQKETEEEEEEEEVVGASADEMATMGEKTFMSDVFGPDSESGED